MGKRAETPEGQPKKRRKKGEGSVYWDAKRERWVAVADWGRRLDGSHDRKTLYARSQEEVLRKLQKVQRDHDRGIPLPDERLTVGQFLADWLETVVKPPGRDIRTYALYRSAVELHIVPMLGRIRLAKLSVRDVEGWKNAQLRTGLAPRTVQIHHGVLRNAINHAMKDEIIQRNVAEIAGGPAVRKVEVEPFSEEDAVQLLAAIRGDRLEAFVRVGLALGLRPGEILGLRWADVDFGAETITVRTMLQRYRGLRLKETKTEKANRVLPLPDVLLAVLLDHRDRQATERKAAGRAWQDFGLVFTTTIGTPIHSSNVDRHFRDVFARPVSCVRIGRLGEDAYSLRALDAHGDVLLDETGATRQHIEYTVGRPLANRARRIPVGTVEEVRGEGLRVFRRVFKPYDLRHTAATLLLAQGVELKVIQEILGHSRIDTTANVYTHVNLKLKRSAIDRLGGILGPK